MESPLSLPALFLSLSLSLSSLCLSLPFLSLPSFPPLSLTSLSLLFYLSCHFSFSLSLFQLQLLSPCNDIFSVPLFKSLLLIYSLSLCLSLFGFILCPFETLLLSQFSQILFLSLLFFYFFVVRTSTRWVRSPIKLCNVHSLSGALVMNLSNI